MPDARDPLTTVKTALADLMRVADAFNALAALIDSRCIGEKLILPSDAQDGLAYLVNMLRGKLYDLHSDVECAVQEMQTSGREARS